jgi:hypothetical protein
MVYGILTSFMLPIFFYDKLSIYFLKKKDSNEQVENLKDAFENSKDIIGMSQVLKKIFSFDNIVWMSNQVFSQLQTINCL